MGTGAAHTAVGPISIVAIDQHDRSPLLHDELALRMLPLGTRLLVELTRWRPLRRMMISALEHKMPGGWAAFLCRKRYIDDQLLAAADEGIDVVVILGAGLDTHAYRLPIASNTPVFEVDLPENIERKRAVLHRLYGQVPSHVTLIPIDFETQDLHEVLTSHGYSFDQRTFFVWEAVTQYLTEDAVRGTFTVLAKAHGGSRLVFTYIRKDFIDGTSLYGTDSLYQQYVVKQRLWHFGMHPADVATFLAEYGWSESEQLGPAEFTDRYIIPARRTLAVSPIERSVLAEKSAPSD